MSAKAGRASPFSPQTRNKKMAVDHELRLKIDARPSRQGARQFTAAIEAVRKAVKDLDRDTTGAFTQLKSISSKVDVTPLTRARAEATALATATDRVTSSTDRAADNIRKMAIQSANALRVSTDQASRLRDRLLSVGDTAGLARLEAGLGNLRSSLISATSGLDIREARAGYADLASELNRTAREAERLNAISISAARAEEAAANAAQTHAAALERLRSAHDPLFASSKRYEAALREIQTLEDAGAMSAASAAEARHRAAQSMFAAGGAADAYAAKARVSGHETAYLAAQFNDIGMMLAAGQSPLMLALQQGTQVSQLLNQMGGRAAILRGLASGFMSMVNPISLATIGTIAGGAALGQWAISAMRSEDAAESFKRQLDALATASGDMQKTVDVLNMSALELAEKYGTAAQRVRELAMAQAELRMGEIREQLRGQLAALDGLTRGFSTSATGGHQLRNTLLRLQDQFDLTRAEAQAFNERLQALGNATTFETQREALQEIVRFAKEAGIELSEFPPELRAAAIQMVDLSNESDAMAQLLRQAQDAISANTSATDNWASAMSGVRAEIDAIGTALAYIGGGVLDNAAKSAELAALQAGKTVQQAAVARERYKREAEWSAREAAAGGGVGGWFQRQLIGAERYQFEQGVTLDEQIANAREAARKAATKSTPKGGNSASTRVETLGDEERQLKRLVKEMNNRTYALGVENDALELVISGQASSLDVARLMVAAQREGAGAIDAQTAAMIRQYEAADVLNERLTRLARDPVSDFLESVPTWREAGRQIEADVLGHLSDSISNFIQTGKMDFQALGDSILATVADIVSDMAVKELVSLLGGNVSGSGAGGFDLGGIVAGLFGAGAEGGYSESLPGRQAAPLSAFRHAPHFAQGTVNTSGIPAVLHPNEAVIPLSKGRKIPVEMGENGGGGTHISMPQVFNISTPDADSFRKSRDQVAADMAKAGQRAMRKNG